MHRTGSPKGITTGLEIYHDAKNIRGNTDPSATWKGLLKSSDDGTVGDEVVYDGFSYTFNKVDPGSNVSYTAQTFGEEWSFSMWMQVKESLYTSWHGFTGDGLGGAYGGYWMWHTSGSLYFYQDAYDDGQGVELWGAGWSPDYFYIEVGNEIAWDTWFNLSITLSDTSSKVNMYINGDEYTKEVPYKKSPNPAMTDMKFKKLGWVWSDRRFPGKIATHKVWSRVLSAAEVLQDYNSLAPRFK